MLPLDSLPSSYNPAGLSSAQIQNLINHTSPQKSSLIDFSFQILDKFTLQPVIVPGLPGREPGDISVNCVSGSIEMNTQRDTHRQMTLDMIDLPGIAFDPLYHRIKVYCDYFDRTYSDAAATRLLHWPIGVFMGIVNQRDLTDTGALMWHLTCYDETFRLFKLKFLNDYVAKAGRTYTAVMQELMTLGQMPPELGGTTVTPDGCPMIGPGIPAARVHIPQDSEQIPEDILWKAGKDVVGKAINQLATGKIQTYWPVYQDEIGDYYSAPQPYYTAAKPSAGWPYDSTAENIIWSPVKQTFSDFSTIVNYIKVLCEPANGAAFWAEAWNMSADSAVSIPNVQEVWPDVINDDTCPSPQDAALRAAIALQMGAVLNDNLTFSTLVNPAHQVHDSPAINLRGKGIAYYVGTGTGMHAERLAGPVLVSSQGYNFEELSWSINMNTREMVHTVSKEVSV